MVVNTIPRNRGSSVSTCSRGSKGSKHVVQKDDDDSLPWITDPPSLRRKKSKGFLGKLKSKDLAPASSEREQPFEEVLIIEDDKDKVEVESTAGDGKIGLSVSFEPETGLVSQMPSFDFARDDATIDSVEITFNHYTEYMKKKERLRKIGEDGDDSEEATCGDSTSKDLDHEDEEEQTKDNVKASSKRSKHSSLIKKSISSKKNKDKAEAKSNSTEDTAGVKSDDNDTSKNSSDKLAHANTYELEEISKLSKAQKTQDLDLAEKNRKTSHELETQRKEALETATESFIKAVKKQDRQVMEKLKTMNQAEVERMKLHVEQIGTAILKRKKERVPVAKTVEDRMKKNLEILEAALDAQKKIETDFAKHKLKSATYKPNPRPASPKDPSDNLVEPPPLKAGLKPMNGVKKMEEATVPWYEKIFFWQSAHNEKAQKEVVSGEKSPPVEVAPEEEKEEEPAEAPSETVGDELTKAYELTKVYNEIIEDAKVLQDTNSKGEFVETTETTPGRFSKFKKYILKQKDSIVKATATVANELGEFAEDLRHSFSGADEPDESTTVDDEKKTEDDSIASNESEEKVTKE